MGYFKPGKESLQRTDFDCIEFGGATLSSNILGLSCYRKGLLIVDPLVYKITKPLLRMMKSNEFDSIPQFLNNTNCYDSIPQEKYERVASYYQLLGKTAGEAISSVKLKDERFQHTKARSNKVICLFPHPVLMPPGEIIESALKILVEGGTLEVATENVDWLQTALEFMQDYGIKGESKVIDSLNLPLSVYDIFYEKNPVKFSLEVRK